MPAQPRLSGVLAEGQYRAEVPKGAAEGHRRTEPVINVARDSSAYTRVGGALTQKMGIEVLELTAAHSVARMPVEGNTQPLGLLHGGAHLVLAETLGSLSAAVHAGPGHYPVGIEIGASHTGSVREGWVIGTCDAIALGRTLVTHEVVIRDEAGRRLSTVRITNLIREVRE
ncbi:PaaI family thioesterase [Ruicaihuangia caeni]|uniref:Hotdog fold thioesterase n=1 Tax=Ruicaihuangia caeni TaxID=3042517 RepID=A0AAW6T3S7_9MICO|nr:hotdog fold thioesterase [Klugiella sp. YN-L-19]MDI2098099.1 hotdog fold thioesterase [Klugiella sp. YN-L-19]